MTVHIGNAVGDEHGKSRGGKPGNQTGRELRVQPWYANKKGWRVFRAKSSEVAQRLAENMKAACENTAIGYDQIRADRASLYNEAAKVGFDCSKVTTPCECDCSSLVWVCLAYAGVRVGNFNTSTEPSVLLKTGQFVEVKEHTDSPDWLKLGDILVTKVKGHTAIVLNDGPKASEDPAPEPEPPKTDKVVLAIGGSVRVRDKDNTNGKRLFTAHKGDKFPLIEVAPSGWYRIETEFPESYISCRKDLTKLVEK